MRLADRLFNGTSTPPSCGQAYPDDVRITCLRREGHSGHHRGANAEWSTSSSSEGDVEAGCHVEPGEYAISVDHGAGASETLLLVVDASGRHELLRSLERVQLKPTRPRLPPRRVKDVPCPRCKAPAGTDCDPRTLGRHPHHAARVAAWHSEDPR